MKKNIKIVNKKVKQLKKKLSDTDWADKFIQGVVTAVSIRGTDRILNKVERGIDFLLNRFD